MLFKLINKIQLATASFFVIISGFVYSEPIGGVIESTGVTSLVRESERLLSDVGSDVNIYDEAETANGRMLIEFKDEEELALTEHTRIYIDEVYYDPDPSLSKMTMRMALGTARFTSGTGARIDKANVDISTPTAQIGIRGTDFTATVDELGRTLIILLPDEFGDASGEIVVSSMMGQVTLNKPYQATTVSLSEKKPSSPKILDITLGLIDNMLIVSPPKEEISEEELVERTESILDFNDLDVELLEDELEKDAEALEFTELDIDLLDVDFLRDLLDVFEEIDREEEEDALQEEGVLALVGTNLGFDPTTQISTFLQGQQVVLQRQVENYARLELMQNSGYTIKLDDGGERFNIIINTGGDVYISIVQE